MSEITIEELKERVIEQMDTDDLLEVLQIDITELVEAFTDKIEEHYDRLVQELCDELGEGSFAEEEERG
jgi:predicted nucleic acid-binding protein